MATGLVANTVFQSAPGAEAGRNGMPTYTALPRAEFQSAPGAEAGRNGM